MAFEVAERIKALRKEQKISTNKLSNLAGLSQSYVRKLEQNQTSPTVESLDLLCGALHISIQDFFNFPEKSLQELKIMNLFQYLSDAQKESLYGLLSPYSTRDLIMSEMD